MALYGHNYGIVSEGFWLLILGEVAAEMSKSSFPFSGVPPVDPTAPTPNSSHVINWLIWVLQLLHCIITASLFFGGDQVFMFGCRINRTFVRANPEFGNKCQSSILSIWHSECIQNFKTFNWYFFFLNPYTVNLYPHCREIISERPDTNERTPIECCEFNWILLYSIWECLPSLPHSVSPGHFTSPPAL